MNNLILAIHLTQNKTQKVETLAIRDKKSTSNTGAEHSTTYLRMGKHPTKDTLVTL